MNLATKAIGRANLPVLLRHARSTFGTAIRKALNDAGFEDVPQNGLYVFGCLNLDGSSLPLSELIAGINLSKQAAGQLVDVLVTRGYVKREHDPNDRRKLTVALAERGLAAARVQRTAREGIQSALVARIGADGVEAMKHYLLELISLGA